MIDNTTSNNDDFEATKAEAKQNILTGPFTAVLMFLVKVINFTEQQSLPIPGEMIDVFVERLRRELKELNPNSDQIVILIAQLESLSSTSPIPKNKEEALAIILPVIANNPLMQVINILSGVIKKIATDGSMPQPEVIDAFIARMNKELLTSTHPGTTHMFTSGLRILREFRKTYPPTPTLLLDVSLN